MGSVGVVTSVVGDGDGDEDEDEGWEAFGEEKAEKAATLDGAAHDVPHIVPKLGMDPFSAAAATSNPGAPALPPAASRLGNSPSDPFAGMGGVTSAELYGLPSTSASNPFDDMDTDMAAGGEVGGHVHGMGVTSELG